MRINVIQPSLPDFEEFCREIEPLWQSKQLTNCGKLHNQLEERVTKYLGAVKAALFTNGHAALEAAIASFALKGEVITTPFTFASTTQAIVRCGLTPVFCDVKETDFTINPEKIERLITPKTTAIVPVHVYGNLCDTDAINSIAQKHGLKVIYDAAHAFGEEVNGRAVGAFGDASIFSFHATKVFNTIEGGCVTYRDQELTEKLCALRNFGMKSEEEFIEVAGNGKMNEFQAAMGLCNLRHVDDEIMKRKAVVHRYQENLDGLLSVKVWHEQPGVKHNYAYFPVFFEGNVRDCVARRLAENEIYARRYFYPLTSKFDCFRGRFPIQETPVAEKAAGGVLTLPLYADLPLDEVDRICAVVRSALR